MCSIQAFDHHQKFEGSVVVTVYSRDIATDELILNAARAHLEDIKLVNQTGSALIPPSFQARAL